MLTGEESTATGLVLRLQRPEREDGDGQEMPLQEISVRDKEGRVAGRFHLMCAALYDDIQQPGVSGPTALKEMDRVLFGEVDRMEAAGNAWVIHIARDKVWFKGMRSQEEGGEISFEQYRLAVKTYLRFLADPYRRPITVRFPSKAPDEDAAGQRLLHREASSERGSCSEQRGVLEEIDGQRCTRERFLSLIKRGGSSNDFS